MDVFQISGGESFGMKADYPCCTDALSSTPALGMDMFVAVAKRSTVFIAFSSARSASPILEESQTGEMVSIVLL